MKTKVLLEGPILTQSGYGEHCRLVFRSLIDQENLDIYINPVNWGDTGWLHSHDSERSSIEECIKKFSKYIDSSKNNNINMSFDLQVFVGILNEFEKRAEKSVCVTAGIETSIVSSNWLLKTHEGVDKLVVPSEHAKWAFDNTSFEVSYRNKEDKTILECACPIEVVPYPVKDVKSESLDLNIDTKFNFLSIALLGPRKNLEKMIQWFSEEFKDEESVGLILKTGVSKGSVIDRESTRNHIKEVMRSLTPDRKCKIYLLHGDLSEGQINSLYNREDVHCYLTATHGEGYGLPIFEAAYNGLPIVATNWSGHLDFLSGFVDPEKKKKRKELFAKVDYELHEIPKSVVWENILIEESKWAFPKEDSFKMQMRNVYSNYSKYKNYASSLKSQLLQSHRSDLIKEKMLKAVVPEEMRIENSWMEALSEIEIL